MRVLAYCCLFVALAVPALGDDSKSSADPSRPPAIEAQDIPVVPPELIERLRPYGAYRSAGFGGWAPDGRGMLIGTRFGDTSQVHRVYEPGGRREQLTFFAEPTGGRFLPAAKDGALLLTNSRGGSEQGQIFLQVPGAAELRLTDGKSRNLLGPVATDGTLAIFTSNRRNGKDTDIYAVDPRDPASVRMVYQTDSQYWVPQDLSADKQRLAMRRYVSINESYAAVLDIATSVRTDIPMGEGKTAVGNMAFSPDGSSLYMTTDAGNEFQQFGAVDLKTRKFNRLAQTEWDVDSVEVDRTSGRVALSINEHGASKLFLFAGGALEPIKGIPQGIVSSLEFSPDGKQLGFTLSRSDRPSDAYSYSLNDQTLTRWTYSETAGLQPDQFVQPKLIEYPTFDKRKIPAFYYRPADASREKPVPVVIRIHGGPESQTRPYFSGTIQALVREQGFAVLAPNVRGSRGYGKSYLLLDNGMKREDSVRDIGALLDWIEQQPELDASRVAVTGGSYGGYMVLASLVNFPKRIKAGVDVVGIANFITFLKRTSAYRRDLRRAEYGDERDPAMRAFFEKINPTSRVDQIESALLVAHGLNDPRVPASESQQIAAKLRTAGHTVWTIYANNEGHGFRKRPNRDYVSAVTHLFLARQLGK